MGVSWKLTTQNGSPDQSCKPVACFLSPLPHSSCLARYPADSFYQSRFIDITHRNLIQTVYMFSLCHCTMKICDQDLVNRSLSAFSLCEIRHSLYMLKHYSLLQYVHIFRLYLTSVCTVCITDCNIIIFKYILTTQIVYYYQHYYLHIIILYTVCILYLTVILYSLCLYAYNLNVRRCTTANLSVGQNMRVELAM